MEIYGLHRRIAAHTQPLFDIHHISSDNKWDSMGVYHGFPTSFSLQPLLLLSPHIYPERPKVSQNRIKYGM